MEILEDIIKIKFNSGLIYSKKCVKAKRTHAEWGFQYLYAPVILINSVYGKKENYYPKLFLEKHKFSEDMEIHYGNSHEKCYDEECINLFLETLKK